MLGDFGGAAFAHKGVKTRFFQRSEAFLQSKMHAKGVRGSDCHDSHSARPVATGNAVCTQCHSEAGHLRFPSLNAARYDDPAHHFHAPDSEGAQCKFCHMIERTYMQIDGQRDHSFRIPRPDLTVETGSPNACTDCHADRDADWAAAEIASRFPGSRHRVALHLPRADAVTALAMS